MSRKYIAFDIETAKVIPEGDDLQAHRPLGICCWAVAWVSDKTGEIAVKSYSGTDNEGGITPQMTETECVALVQRLRNATEQGYTILTHNGVGFDFDILAEESGMVDTCAELAMNSVDTCFQVLCTKGFPVGLEAIAKGMGLQGKTEGMNGALAPQMWAEGRYDEVLAYVAQDVRCTLEVALAVEQAKSLRWLSKSGRINSLPVRQWVTVQEALQLPEPDTSWMSEPIPRSRWTEWMEALHA